MSFIDRLSCSDVITPPPIAERSIVMTVSVCVSVSVCACLYASISLEIRVRSLPIFVHVTLPTAVARSSSGGVAICYVLPVLLMTS